MVALGARQCPGALPLFCICCLLALLHHPFLPMAAQPCWPQKQPGLLPLLEPTLGFILDLDLKEEQKWGTFCGEGWGTAGQCL